MSEKVLWQHHPLFYYGVTHLLYGTVFTRRVYASSSFRREKCAGLTYAPGSHTQPSLMIPTLVAHSE